MPELLYTRASRILIYAFGAFLVGDNPTLLRNGYSQSPPEALASLIQRIVGALASKQLYEHDAQTVLKRHGQHPSRNRPPRSTPCATRCNNTSAQRIGIRPGFASA